MEDSNLHHLHLYLLLLYSNIITTVLSHIVHYFNVVYIHHRTFRPGTLFLVFVHGSSVDYWNQFDLVFKFRITNFFSVHRSFLLGVLIKYVLFLYLPYCLPYCMCYLIMPYQLYSAEAYGILMKGYACYIINNHRWEE